MVTSCLERFGRSSAVLAGLSMGALVALETALADPTGLQGLVIAAAPLGPVRASKFALLLTRLLSRLAPTLPIAPRLDLASISKDAALVKEYVSDPLFHQRLTIGFAKELLSASARLRTAVADLRIPTLHLHGEADRIAPWDEASVRAFPQHLYSRRLYGAAGHNLFLETERSDVFSDIVQWLSSLRR